MYQGFQCFYESVISMNKRFDAAHQILTGCQGVVSSSLATRTMRSVLIGSEYPTKATPHFYCQNWGSAGFIEQQPIPDAQELYLVPGKQVNVALGHAPLPAYPGQAMD